MSSTPTLRPWLYVTRYVGWARTVAGTIAKSRFAGAQVVEPMSRESCEASFAGVAVAGSRLRNSDDHDLHITMDNAHGGTRVNSNLAGRVAMVTGGNGGIGRSIALGFAEAGAACGNTRTANEEKTAESLPS
jgi:hypothetical protein